MALNHRSRSAIYNGLHSLVGEQAVEDMLSEFPSRPDDEPVTKQYLSAEFVVERATVQAEFAAVRAEMQAEFAAVRAEMQTEFAAVRSEMHAGAAELSAAILALRVDLEAGLRSQTRWMVATMLTVTSVLLAAVALAG